MIQAFLVGCGFLIAGVFLLGRGMRPLYFDGPWRPGRIGVVQRIAAWSAFVIGQGVLFFVAFRLPAFLASLSR